MRLSTKLTLLFSVIFLIISTVITYLVYTSNIRVLEDHIKDRLKNQAFHTMDKIDRMLFERYGDIKTLVSDSVISSRKSSPQQITERLLEFKKNYRYYFSLSFFDLNRVKIADTEGKDIGRQHALSEYWPEISGGKDFTYDIGASESLNRTIFYFASVVKDKTGAPFGFVVSRVPIESLYEIVRQGVGIYNVEKDFLIELVDKDGRIIYSNDEEVILKETPPDWGLISESLKKGMKTGTIKHVRPTGKRGEEILVFTREQGYEDFKGSDWTLIMEVPTKVAFALAIELRNKIIIIFLAIALFNIPIVFLFSHRISKTIKNLSDASVEIGKGNLDVKVESRSKDESGRLAEVFNKMVVELRQNRDRLLDYSRDLEIKVAERTAELQVSEKKYRDMVENINAIIYYTDKDGVITYMSPLIEKYSGYSLSEIIDHHFSEFIYPGDLLITRDHFQKHLSGIYEPFDIRVLTKSGEIKWVIVNNKPVLKDGEIIGFYGVTADITKRKQMEEQISKFLKEKELLLKEVNHRVKGNLQVIISMLRVQANRMKSEEISEVFKEIENRIRVIGLVHEKLYQSEDLSNINFGGYIKSIIRGLFTSYGATASRVSIKTEIDNIFLGIDKAIPFGMIVNELISNSLRHAFSVDSSGEIQVILRKNGDSHELIVKDNGIGIPEELDFRNPETLGLQMINILVKQIGGTIDLNGAEGTEFHIRLKV